MKKFLSLLLTVVLLSACTPQPVEWNALSILAPKGAPAVALIPLLEKGLDTLEFVDGADLLSAELIKGEKDVIVAPVNLGAALTSKGSSLYELYAIVTWGNLYVVGAEVQPAIYPLNIALFGDKAVPGVVFNQVDDNLGYQGTYFNSVSDVQGQLLSGAYSLGLLAEPLVTATIAKAKASNLTLRVVQDVQALWKEKTGFDNFPQAAIFVKKDLSEDALAQVSLRVDSMIEFNTTVDTDPSVVVEKIATVTPELIGVPSGEIVKAAWERLNISVTRVSEVKDSVEAFLEVFKLNGLEGFYAE